MIYDVNSPQYQQFLRSSGRRREDYTKGVKTGPVPNKKITKAGGAASTGLVKEGTLVYVMKRLFDRFYHATGIISDSSQRSVASRVSSVLVQGTLAFSLLGTLGVDTSPLVAAAGITGATIGFACKDFGSNFIASIALSGQQSLRTGNRVAIGSGAAAVKGEVVDWDTRYLYLRSSEGHLLHIPNNMVLNSVVSWEKDEKQQPPNITTVPKENSAGTPKDNSKK